MVLKYDRAIAKQAELVVLECIEMGDDCIVYVYIIRLFSGLVFKSLGILNRIIYQTSLTERNFIILTSTMYVEELSISI